MIWNNKTRTELQEYLETQQEGKNRVRISNIYIFTMRNNSPFIEVSIGISCVNYNLNELIIHASFWGFFFCLVDREKMMTALVQNLCLLITVKS